MSGLPGHRGDPLDLALRPLGRDDRLRGGRRHLLRAPARQRAAARRRARRSRRASAPRRWGRSRPASARSTSSRCEGDGLLADGAAHDPRLGDRASRLRVGARRHRGQRLRRRAQAVPGGGRPGEARLRTASSLGQVFEALERNNANAGGGYIEHDREQYVDPRRGPGREPRATSTTIVVDGRSDGTPGHVAQRRRGARFAPMPRTAPPPATARARPSSASSLMLTGENSRVVAERVQARRSRRSSRRCPPGVTHRALTTTARSSCDASIRTVATNLVEGGAARRRRAVRFCSATCAAG